MTTVPRAEPTEEELRSAWVHCTRRARSPWPATFEEAMAHPTLSRLVVLTAKHPPRALRRHAAPPPPHQVRARLFDPKPPVREQQSLPLPGMSRGIDRKRAAAGERDDD